MSLSVQQRTTIKLKEMVNISNIDKTLTTVDFEVLDEDTVVVAYEDDDDYSDFLMSFNMKTKQKIVTLKMKARINSLAAAIIGQKTMLASSHWWAIN